MKARSRKRRLSSEVEINLIPIMDIFVALIPFLLLTASFIRLSGVGVETPTFGNAGIESGVDANSEKVRLTFQIENDSILVSGFENNFKKSIPEVQRTFSMSELRRLSEYLQELHGRYLHLDFGIVHAASAVSYQDVVQVIDVIESTKSLTSVMLAAGGGDL